MADSADLYIYDEIDKMVGVGADGFVKKLNALPRVGILNLHINSPGGDVFEAVAIINALKQYRLKYQSQLVTYNDGLAASASSMVYMIGDKRVAANNSMLMVHMPLSFAFGNAADFRKVADLLDKIATDSIAPTYAEATKLDIKEILDMMAVETWFSSQEAMDKGFSTEIAGAEQSASATLALPEKFRSAYRNTPKCLLEAKPVEDKQEQPKPVLPNLSRYENDIREMELMSL